MKNYFLHTHIQKIAVDSLMAWSNFNGRTIRLRPEKTGSSSRCCATPRCRRISTACRAPAR
jgi:hypothetical protein